MHCDPIPFDRVAAIVATASPSREANALHDAWRDYAGTAARPYAWGTFAKYLRRHLRQRAGPPLSDPIEAERPAVPAPVSARAGAGKSKPPDRAKTRSGPLTRWQTEAPASPRVLVLGARANVRVRGGGLEIEHGARNAAGEVSERVALRVDIDARTRPDAILFDGAGEFITGDAIRFCARHSIALIWPDGPGRIITMIQSEAEARDPKVARSRDVDPALVMAQCAAAADGGKSIAIAREIVCAKIAAQAHAVADQATRSALAEWIERSEAARTLPEVLTIEAHAAAVYWREFRHMGLREQKVGNLPRSWKRYPLRNRGRPAFHAGVGEPASKTSPQHASHPINAMLNYAYVIEAGRLARALSARGLHLAIGFLHKPKRGRNSLVWDAIEPLRPAIDARVFEFVAHHEFSRSDFPQAGLNVWRLSREITQLMVHSVMLPGRDIEAAADWVANLVMAVASVRDARRSSRRQTEPARAITKRRDTDALPSATSHRRELVPSVSDVDAGLASVATPLGKDVGVLGKIGAERV